MNARIRLSRARGWRLPEGARHVARPSRWGNPYTVGKDGTREECVAMFAAALAEGRLRFTIDDVRRELVGHDLACWCLVGHECHADVLLRVAAGEDPA